MIFLTPAGPVKNIHINTESRHHQPRRMACDKHLTPLEMLIVTIWVQIASWWHSTEVFGALSARTGHVNMAGSDETTAACKVQGVAHCRCTAAVVLLSLKYWVQEGGLHGLRDRMALTSFFIIFFFFCKRLHWSFYRTEKWWELLYGKGGKS